MKAVVSVIGKDRKGIIAEVSGILYKNGVNILDISQTIMQDEYFTMVMMIELEENAGLSKLGEELSLKGKELGVEIRIQHEDVFNSMHRI